VRAIRLVDDRGVRSRADGYGRFVVHLGCVAASHSRSQQQEAKSPECRLNERTGRRAESAGRPIAIALAAYALLYIFRMSFLVDGVRYFTLADDQMISMRYAENLAHGHGLVWNAGGPRVEGYTNFLWMLYMAAFHLLP